MVRPGAVRVKLLQLLKIVFNCMNHEQRTVSHSRATSPHVHLAAVNAALQQCAEWATKILYAAIHRQNEKIAVPTHAQKLLKQVF